MNYHYDNGPRGRTAVSKPHSGNGLQKKEETKLWTTPCKISLFHLKSYTKTVDLKVAQTFETCTIMVSNVLNRERECNW